MQKLRGGRLSGGTNATVGLTARRSLIDGPGPRPTRLTEKRPPFWRPTSGDKAPYTCCQQMRVHDTQTAKNATPCRLERLRPHPSARPQNGSPSMPSWQAVETVWEGGGWRQEGRRAVGRGRWAVAAGAVGCSCRGGSDGRWLPGALVGGW